MCCSDLNLPNTLNKTLYEYVRLRDILYITVREEIEDEQPGRVVHFLTGLFYFCLINLGCFSAATHCPGNKSTKHNSDSSGRIYLH